MIRDMFEKEKKIGFTKIEMVADNVVSKPEAPKEYEAQYSDTVSWNVRKNTFDVAFERNVILNPEINLHVLVSYCVTHTLKNPGSMDEINGDDLKQEVLQDVEYYIQSESGIMERLSLIIAQLTSSAINTPLILPPKMLDIK